MGKHAMSMPMFNSYVSHYRRVDPQSIPPTSGSKGLGSPNIHTAAHPWDPPRTSVRWGCRSGRGNGRWHLGSTGIPWDLMIQLGIPTVGIRFFNGILRVPIVAENKTESDFMTFPPQDSHIVSQSPRVIKHGNRKYPTKSAFKGKNHWTKWGILSARHVWLPEG